jgi:hypothetical protein
MNEENKKPKGWISFRVKNDQYKKIYSFYLETKCRKLSDYARKVLLQKPVVIIYRNQTAEDFLAQMIELKKDLRSTLKMFSGESKTSKQILISKVEEISLRLDQIYELWCRK